MRIALEQVGNRLLGSGMKEIKLRLTDSEIAREFDFIKKENDLSSDNATANFIIKKGIDLIKGERTNEKVNAMIEKKLDENTRKNIAFMKLSIDEMYVTQNIIKQLVATLYNIKIEEINGEIIDKMLLETGGFSILPERLQEIENEMIARVKKERLKNGKHDI